MLFQKHVMHTKFDVYIFISHIDHFKHNNNNKIHWYFSLFTGDSVNLVECYDPIINRWTVVDPMTTIRSRVGVSVHNGQLIADLRKKFRDFTQSFNL